MAKRWELIDECKNRPFSGLNLTMIRISTRSGYDGLKKGILFPDIPSEDDIIQNHPELQFDQDN